MIMHHQPSERTDNQRKNHDNIMTTILTAIFGENLGYWFLLSFHLLAVPEENLIGEVAEDCYEPDALQSPNNSVRALKDTQSTD